MRECPGEEAYEEEAQPCEGRGPSSMQVVRPQGLDREMLCRLLREAAGGGELRRVSRRSNPMLDSLSLDRKWVIVRGIFIPIRVTCREHMLNLCWGERFL